LFGQELKNKIAESETNGIDIAWNLPLRGSMKLIPPSPPGYINAPHSGVFCFVALPNLFGQELENKNDP
jgi:hypothetical protein